MMLIEPSGPKWAEKNDKKLLLSEIFLKTRVDELPQLILVLKGDSLIGHVLRGQNLTSY